jgi:hypothetical protein
MPPGTRSADADLREHKIRADRLLKDLLGADAARALQAAGRFRALPPLAACTPADVLARRDSLRHKHALAVIAAEAGHASWADLKHALEQAPAPAFDPEALLARAGSHFLNRWFPSYAEARDSLRARGGYLFPYRRQFFICEAGLLRAVGVDPADPDWERIAGDWVQPADPAAHRRLEARLVEAGLMASPLGPGRALGGLLSVP